MTLLMDDIRTTLGNGLIRSSATTCSRWAARYRYVMDNGIIQCINYNMHPWTMAMRDCDRSWVGPKAAQMGYTEVCIDRAFFTLDVKKQSVLYLLPKKTPDATDFSASRFDPALEMSPHIRTMFAKASNVGHKRAGSASLFIRGTMSRSGVKSVPVSLVIFDEKDEMNQKNIAQARERMSGQTEKQSIEISTPSVSKWGIDKTYRQSTQQHFFFKCPCCGRHTELEFFDDKGQPKCLVITADNPLDQKIKQSYLKCKECNGKLPHESKSEWLTKAMWRGKAGWQVTANHDSDLDGFYINQLYSFKMTPPEIAAVCLEAIYDPATEQELWNSKAGLPHEVDGARVSDAMIDSILGGHSLKDPRPVNVIVTMGVDVGKWLYYHIDAWYFPQGITSDLNTYAHKFTVQVGRVTDFEQLDTLMKDWQVNHCVVDANPERRKATEFKERFYGHVNICFYNRGIVGKDMIVNNDAGTVSVDRTSWLDVTMARFKKQTQKLPRDIPHEYREHIKALVREPRLDPYGNPIAQYINTDPDHFAHACNYSEIALPLAMSILSNQDIKVFL